jgi:hypothetical protein
LAPPLLPAGPGSWRELSDPGPGRTWNCDNSIIFASFKIRFLDSLKGPEVEVEVVERVETPGASEKEEDEERDFPPPGA